MVKILSLTLIIFALLASEAYAINLGSVIKNDFNKIDYGESAKFTILVWNSEDEYYNLKLTVRDAPKDWIVIIDPEEILINRETGKEYVSLSTNDRVKATSVNVFVKPTNDSISGRYFVTIVAIPETSNTGLFILPERIFKFTIDLGNYEKREKETSSEVTSRITENELGPIRLHNANNDYIFYIFSIFSILLISFILYKLI